MSTSKETTVRNSMPLNKVVETLQILEAKKRDLICPPQSMFFKAGKMHVIASNGQRLDLELSHLAVAQMCERLRIPRSYGHMLNEEYPELLEANVNMWLEKEAQKEKRRNFLLRNYVDSATEGKMRAFLSDRYFDISSLRLLTEVINVVAEVQAETGIHIAPTVCDLTDRNLYVRFVAPHLEVKSEVLKYFKDTPTGKRHDGFFTGAVICNSEVGRGMFMAAPRIITGACQNGNVYTSEQYVRKHLGGLQEIGDVQWSDETIEAEINVITAKTRDLFKYWFSSDFLGKTVSQLEALAEVKLEHPMDAVVNLAAEMSLSKEKVSQVLNYLAGCGMGDNLFGVMQSFTGAAKNWHSDDLHDVEEKVTELVMGEGRARFDQRSKMSKKFFSEN